MLFHSAATHLVFLRPVIRTYPIVDPKTACGISAANLKPKLPLQAHFIFPNNCSITDVEFDSSKPQDQVLESMETSKRCRVESWPWLPVRSCALAAFSCWRTFAFPAPVFTGLVRKCTCTPNQIGEIYSAVGNWGRRIEEGSGLGLWQSRIAFW